MAIADLIPTLDDKALANLHDNAVRLQAGPETANQKRAVVLLPIIEAELAERDAKKPPKRVTAPPKRKSRAKTPAADV
jgi:hypothetical protein